MSGTRMNTLARRTSRDGLTIAAGYVYLIDDGMDVKIGFARDPYKRLALLQTGNSEPLRLIAAIPGTRQTERDIHELFGHARIRGEWFHPSLEMALFFEERM